MTQRLERVDDSLRNTLKRIAADDLAEVLWIAGQIEGWEAFRRSRNQSLLAETPLEHDDLGKARGMLERLAKKMGERGFSYEPGMGDQPGTFCHLKTNAEFSPKGIILLLQEFEWTETKASSVQEELDSIIDEVSEHPDRWKKYSHLAWD